MAIIVCNVVVLWRIGPRLGKINDNVEETTLEARRTTHSGNFLQNTFLENCIFIIALPYDPEVTRTIKSSLLDFISWYRAYHKPLSGTML